MENDVLLSIEEVASCFQVSVRTVQRYVKAGLLIPVRVGRLIRFREDFVLAVKVKLTKES